MNVNLGNKCYLEAVASKVDIDIGHVNVLPGFEISWLKYKTDPRSRDWTIQFSWCVWYVEVTFNWGGV